jgi:hypothetical protein
MATMTKFGNRAVSSRNKRGVGLGSEPIQHLETYVVASLGILCTDITQAYNQIFHNSLLEIVV